MAHSTTKSPAKTTPPERSREAALGASELSDDKLEALLGRLRSLTSDGAAAGQTAAPESPLAAVVRQATEFCPPEPASLKETGIGEAEVSALVLKYLLKSNGASGRAVAAQMRLPFHMIHAILGQMKIDQRIVYKTSIDPGDFLCELTTAGAEHARRSYQTCAYCGAVPVPLADYIAGVEAQSLGLQRPELADVRRALGDLSVSPQLISRIAQAIRAGRGMFLYGAPGNGKTSVAERITRAFGQYIWIPRAISVDGEIIKLYDPCCHEELPLEAEKSPKFDLRWIRIRRPTVVAGGELTMDRLEAQLNKVTGICEAPIQMKSNCGTLVIDDFGRQRMAISELLNRWIVPLEKRFDYITLPSGRAVQIPFDQLIVFSTNLEPRSLVDEAFLRRIPYKIDFADPSEAEFRALFDAATVAIGFAPSSEAVSYLIEKHYRAVERPFRYCQPRDLLKQVQYYCEVHRLPPQLTPEAFDMAVANYFSVL
jgi:hypothetical protein